MNFKVSSRYSGYFEITMYKVIGGERVSAHPSESFPILFRTDVAARNCAAALREIWADCNDWSLMVGNLLFFTGSYECCRLIQSHWSNQGLMSEAKVVRSSRLIIPPGYEDRREIFLTLVIDGFI